MRATADQVALGDRPEFIWALETAVPLWAVKWRGRPVDQQVARARSLGQFVATHGDRILYRSKGGPTRRHPGTEPIPNPSSAEAFNALAEGVALLTLICPGGCDLFGRHWHDGCSAGPVADWHPPLKACADL